MSGFQNNSGQGQFTAQTLRIAAAGVLAIATAVASGCGKTSAGDPTPGGAPPPMPGEVENAQAEEIPGTTGDISVFKAPHSGTNNPHLGGFISKIFLKSGGH